MIAVASSHADAAFHCVRLQEPPAEVFSARYIGGEDVRHAPRPWTTSPDFPGLTETLAAGAPMDHPLFPLVWRG